jgi:L-aminopeptidase/D-esterase-like protein
LLAARPDQEVVTHMSSITDVPGIRVGHAQRVGDGWLTGVTVVLPPPGTLGGVDVRGAAPGTHETDALRVGSVAPYPHAIVLTGGSAYGLVSAFGVKRWCEANGLGYPVGPLAYQVVPIVPAAAIFDLGRGGDFGARPDEQMGYDAVRAAAASTPGEPVARGTVGAGTGAALAAATFKGGVGTASTRLDLGHGVSVVVGALVVVNALGSPLTHPATDRSASGPAPIGGSAGDPSAPPLNTTLVVVATDAVLGHAQLTRTGTAAHDGLARALDPVHTLADGDTVFTLSTGQVRLPGDTTGTADTRACRDSILIVQAAAAHVVHAAVIDAVRSATEVTTPAIHLPAFPWPR